MQHQWLRLATVGKLHVANSCKTTKCHSIIFDGQQCHAGENATKNDWKQNGDCDLENKDFSVTECDVLVNSGFE